MASSTVAALLLVGDLGPSPVVTMIARFLNGDKYELKMVAVQLVGIAISDDNIAKCVANQTQIIDFLVEGLN